jgi:hypothetical protein
MVLNNNAQKKDLVVEDIANLLALKALVGTPAGLFFLALMLAPTIISTWWFFAIPWRLYIIIELLEKQNALLKKQANNMTSESLSNYQNATASGKETQISNDIGLKSNNKNSQIGKSDDRDVVRDLAMALVITIALIGAIAVASMFTKT